MRRNAEDPDWQHSTIIDDADTVVLFLHGMNCGPLTLEDLIAAIRLRAEDGGRKVSMLVPDMALRWNACFDVPTLSRKIAYFVADQLRNRQVNKLIIAGHSAGGLIAQSVYLDLVAPECLGADGPPQVLNPLLPLEGLHIRLALIAPLTRGWEFSHHLPAIQMIAWKLASSLSHLIRLKEWVLRTRRPLWILQVRKGSTFLINQRLRWLEVQQRFEAGNERPLPLPEIVTLLGCVDEIISWRDMVDSVHPKARYLEVPRSNHAQIVDVADAHDGSMRKGMILDAMFGPLDGAEWPPADDDPLPVNREVKRMVFVIHGIRDLGHWTQKIGTRCKAEFRRRHESGSIAIETSSYGFFSMLEFLLTSAKSDKVRWLVDEYVEAKRRFPEAQFSYIGHSNGTYLLAEALAQHPRIAFQRIAFAGSVVDRNYDWAARVKQGQVRSVLNFAADADWVVAFFPRLAESLPFLRPIFGRHLGGAGIAPFPESEQVKSNDFVVGGHGAAIDEWNWDHLATFAVSTNLELPTEDPNINPRYTPRTRWFCRPTMAILAFVLLMLSVVWLGFLSWCNPLFFWGGSMAIVIPSLIFLVWYGSRADSKSFAVRKRILKRTGTGFFILAGMLLVWHIAPGMLYALDCLQRFLRESWNASGPVDPCPVLVAAWENWSNAPAGNCWPKWLFRETTRTLSLGLYLFGLHRVLTRF